VPQFPAFTPLAPTTQYGLFDATGSLLLWWQNGALSPAGVPIAIATSFTLSFDLEGCVDHVASGRTQRLLEGCQNRKSPLSMMNRNKRRSCDLIATYALLPRHSPVYVPHLWLPPMSKWFRLPRAGNGWRWRIRSA
jgi:hypothetical protein